MREYIERDALAMDVLRLTIVNPSVAQYANAVLTRIQTAPAADVAPVVHARWEWHKDHWECSNCRGSRFHDLALGLDSAYCGRCGATMGGE